MVLDRVREQSHVNILPLVLPVDCSEIAESYAPDWRTNQLTIHLNPGHRRSLQPTPTCMFTMQPAGPAWLVDVHADWVGSGGTTEQI